MCGISAIASYQPVAKNLYQCLINLEYRGYDSCGMAVFDQQDQKINLRKNVGNVEEVNALENFPEMQGQIGIAHTRWATHGGVTPENSHPHFSNDSNFVIVHNGIFSNYQSIKKELIAEGFIFSSDTDTEVFANLLQSKYQDSKKVESAFTQALKELEGSYAISMICIYEPDKIYAVKKDSPLVLGISDGANYVSSDINAFISKTKDIILLDDYEYVILSNNQYVVKLLSDQEIVKKDIIKIEWDQQTAQRGGFSHYMLKEIFDQPLTIKSAMHVADDDIKKIANKFIDKEQSFLIGVGTTFYVAMVGTYLFANYANLYVPAISSDEFPTLVSTNSNQNMLFFSQSGETYDTRMAIKTAQAGEAETSAIVNVVGSSISQMVNDCIFQGSGPEICVVSTKAAVSQMVILWRIALETGVLNGTLTTEKAENIRSNLNLLPDIIEKLINEESGFIRQLAQETNQVKNWLFMGRGVYYPIAMESALKMKEVTYIHAEGLPAGFLKHGTLAMIDESLYSIFFLPANDNSELYKSTLMAIEEVKARGGKVISFCLVDDSETQNLSDHFFVIPDADADIMPLIELVMAQLFSYYSALHLGLNIDKPRNLAKSVTVG
jgi:glutamine---fructose-6-phosphate transaminase (isomerizing)